MKGNSTRKSSRSTLCYGTHGAGDLEQSISAAGNMLPQVEFAIKEAKANKALCELDLVQHKVDCWIVVTGEVLNVTSFVSEEVS